jgi:3-deoxy-D-manno-octulosonic-acid transferase
VPAELAAVIDDLSKSKRPILIAGCVTNYKEQECILDAVAASLKEIDNLLLIFAPRYPEKEDRMGILYEMLTARGLSHMKRTDFKSNKLAGVSTLVLDSIGELKYLYTVSCISFIGRNHNVLEPIAFGNQVIVTPGWNKTYPSFPVYEATKKANLIFESDDPSIIAEQIVRTLKSVEKSNSIKKINHDLESLGGAVLKNQSLIRALLASHATH